jgi:RND family efflux transporter MFP subunit
MMSIERTRSAIPLSLLTLAVAVGGCGTATNEYVPPPPPEVTIARPAEVAITPFVEQNGRTEAAEEAEVRSRVRGFLQQIKFEPGQKVEADQELYTIEKDQYEAEVNSAQAVVESAEAAIAVAEAMVKIAEAEVEKTRLDLNREKSLIEQQATSQAQYDAAVAAADAAKASLESAKANIGASRAEKLRAEAALAQAKLDLGYTVVRAPIAGRITKTKFKLGNLVENGDHLATVVDDDRIFANFSISDRDLLEFMRARRLSMEAEEDFDERDWRGSIVYLRRETDNGFPFEGGLDYIDQSGIQANTGTLGLRAVFDNAYGALVPGLFVTVRVPAADEQFQSLVIPESATLRDQQGTFVLTVGSDNKVEKTRVQVPQSVSGWAIVIEGLEKDMRVITLGQQRAREGLEVAIAEEQMLDVDADTLMRGMSKTSAESEKTAGKGQPTDDGAAEPGKSGGSGEQEDPTPTSPEQFQDENQHDLPRSES